MRSLLLKEWIVNQSLIISMASLMVLGPLFASLFNDNGQNPIFLAVIFGCLYPFIGDMYENTNKSENLINSLPVKRKEIVASKYVGSLLFGLLVTGIVAVIKLFPIFEENSMIEWALGVSSIGLFIAVYLPLLYLLGPRFVMIGMIVLSIVCFTFVPLIINMGLKNGFWGLADIYQQFSTNLLSAVFLGVTLVALLVSWFISGHLYMKKQF